MLPVPPSRSPHTPQEAQILYEKIRMIALWLDSIPLLPVPIGLDAIIGFFPIIGDIIGLFLGLYQVYLTSFYADLPLTLIAQMLLHILVDVIIGIVPYIGDILDVLYKANIYNLQILETWLKNRYGSSIRICE
ncbi:14232_t:CDS:2 [Gigaspora margarita]|uniref:14232_t:CDS:1 n=2 Tax=Gigaspora margarita TaxID=4874 RepID=A0ABN7UCN0_GIGMA|nr:drug:H+ antiporter [Gigaspora margarita]CAG8563577.1 14232_t:CDS:2 [Gigaspora margarita]